MAKTKRTVQESGFVSIVVTLIVMIIISLIVLGFAALARRDQSQALNRQLSAQAFYAAESGVNDAKKLIKANPLTPDISTCNSPVLPNKTLNTTATISYSCVLINQDNLTTLSYSAVGTDKSTIVPINTGTPLQSLTLSWQNNSGSSVFPANANSLPTLSNWNAGHYGAGILRLDLIPITSSFDSTTLINNTFTIFLYPIHGFGSSSVNYIAGSTNVPSQGKVVAVSCPSTGPAKCNITINGLSSSQYYARLKSIYSTSAVTISGKTSSGTAATFKGAQAEIDATGKATDVLRRIRVREPLQLSTTTNFPEFALDSGDSICKLLSVVPAPGVSSDSCPA